MAKKPSLKELEQKVEELKIAYEQSIIYAKELKGEIKDRKKAERALAEERARFERLVELMPDGVILVQDGKILLTNHSFVELLGYSDPQELIGMDIIQIFQSEFRDMFAKVYDFKAYNGNLEPLQRGVCVTQNNKKIWISTNSSVINWKTGPAVLSTIRDITNDMHREAAIQEEANTIRNENIKLKSTIKERYRFGRLVGKSTPMQKVYELIVKAAAAAANIIILGESGTGKELVARAIHEMSDCADNAFIPVNCGAIPENLIESEFFGHRKGAFTGADTDKNGYFHTAHQGVLFLDEVGEIGLNMQVKLLRVLETGEYTPVGETRARTSDVRVIFATNRMPSEMVKQGLMREDFYYRISMIPINLPPLRERKEDIPLLVDHFLTQYSEGENKPVLTGKIMDILYNYEWPGNVRELLSVIRRYLVLGDFPILDMGEKTRGLELGVDNDFGEEIDGLAMAMEIQEKRFILKALGQYRWHKGKTADALKIDPKTLYTKMKKYGIS
jgi:PAS domain S-box-containing protein